MGLYQMKTEQKVPADMKTLWNFISSPRNLSKITPEHMGFQITNEPIPEKMYPGMIISYKVKPLFGIEMNWVSEITQLREYEYFIDEQRVGPYAIWHHEHHVKEIDGGVLMSDIISYKPPFGFLGDIANTIIIKSQLKSIFDFRFQAMEKTFGKFSK
jgi:ligand-binding SRPBCC domain-containing protein